MKGSMKKIVLFMVFFPTIIFPVKRTLKTLCDFQNINPELVDHSKDTVCDSIKKLVNNIRFSDFFIGLILDFRGEGVIYNLDRSSFEFSLYAQEFSGGVTSSCVKANLQEIEVYLKNLLSKLILYLDLGTLDVEVKDIDFVREDVEKLLFKIRLLLRQFK